MYGGGCTCSDADWKREEISDHKFDYIDVEDFLDTSFFSRMRYSWVFVLTLKSILVYMADIGILIIMITAANTLYQLLAGDPNAPCDVSYYGPAVCASTPTSLKKIGGSVSALIPVPARLGIVFASMFFSFLFLIIEWRKGRRIVKSRDISYALTSTVAYRYYSIQSFSHFCFFRKIQNSRRTIDILAFYVFFTFKGWKRLLLAEFPRQLIYGLFVYDIIRAQMLLLPDNYDSDFIKFFAAIYTYYDLNKAKNADVLAQYALMAFTVSVWIFSFLSLCIAFLIYLPLLSKIRGMDTYIISRIDEILRKKSRKRTAKARAAELLEIEKNGNRVKYQGWADDTSSFTTATTATSGTTRAPPPLGMSVGPTVPNVDEREFHEPIQFYNYSHYGVYPQPILYERAYSDTSSISESQNGLLRGSAVGPAPNIPAPYPQRIDVHHQYRGFYQAPISPQPLAPAGSRRPS